MKSIVEGYRELNRLAEGGGIVVFGGKEDAELPLGELGRTFGIEEPMYNRSIPGLKVEDACRAYDDCVAELEPDTVILHTGEADSCETDAELERFDANLRRLLKHIKKTSKRCRIAVVALSNDEKDAKRTEINEHMRRIAAAEGCEFGDISSKRTVSAGTSEAAAFVYRLGFVHSLHRAHPLGDLVDILYRSAAV